VPGPVLTVPPGDTTLTIQLHNTLPEPVSIVIPGQITSMTPVLFTDNQNRQRVRSFTHETQPGATETYTWNNMQAGTYSYHSGTHPAVQVQMGLYGGVKKDVAVGEAYPGVHYDNELILLYSEIDPKLHTAVTTPGGYGPATPMTSTIDYQPQYFLINGEVFTPERTPIPAGHIGQTLLLRLINMGLESHVPTLNGLDMTIIAEDGHPYPYPRRQYSLLLAAGKTQDALVTATQAGRYALYDQRLNLTNAHHAPGGMLVHLEIIEPVTDLDKEVVIFRTFYIPETQWLLVKAVSNELAAMELTAQAHFGDTIETLGPMNYVASKMIHQLVSQNITTKPDKITVVRTDGMGDSQPLDLARNYQDIQVQMGLIEVGINPVDEPSDLAIFRAAYLPEREMLLTKAVSNAEVGSVTLVVQAHFGDTVRTLGIMNYDEGKMIYQKVLEHIDIQPDKITIVSSDGAEDTQTLPYYRDYEEIQAEFGMLPEDPDHTATTEETEQPDQVLNTLK